jgi:hypothetical protein
MSDPPYSVAIASDDERRALEHEADLLETELRHIRTRIDQLRQDAGSES